MTKGHASRKHILAQTNELAIGNSQADLAADLAFEACERGELQQILVYHARKQKAYESLISRLQCFAAKLIVQDKFLRQEAGFQDKGKKIPPVTIEAPPIPPRSCFTEGESLELDTLPPSLQATHEILHIFWNSLRWKHHALARPTTWLELYALYRLLGGGPRHDDPHSKKPVLNIELGASFLSVKACLKFVGTIRWSRS